MARPAKTLVQLMRDGTFRARRENHRLLLADADLPWPGFAVLQARFRAAGSEAERRELAREFERAVRIAHEQTAADQAGNSGVLAAQLAELGPEGSVEQLLAFFQTWLVHPKGPLRGQPFALEPWQEAFVREFYRRTSKGRRVYRLGLLGIPRGNGKTALAAGLALYELISRTDAPEVYFAAPSRDQARIGLTFARAFVENGPLDAHVTVKSKLSCPTTSGVMEVLSSMGPLLHGRAPACAIIDELWALETFAQQEAYAGLTSALHKRQDAYLLAITTAGYNRQSLLGRIYAQAHDYADITASSGGCLTVARDEENGVLFWWYGAPDDADSNDEKVWRACNPASFVDLGELKRQRNDPGLGERGFRRLHLNQFTTVRDAWLPDGAWAALKSDEKIPLRAPVYVGVDVAISHDTTAVCWAHVLDDGRILLRTRIWSADPKAPAHVYVEGGRIQLEQIERFIVDRLGHRFQIREIAYDPHFFHRSAEILDKRGYTLVEYLQAQGPMRDAYQAFYQYTLEGKLAHNGDEQFAAHIEATAASKTEQGWKLRKLRNSGRIDATIAACLAVARARHHKHLKPEIHWFEP